MQDEKMLVRKLQAYVEDWVNRAGARVRDTQVTELRINLFGAAWDDEDNIVLQAHVEERWTACELEGTVHPRKVS